jgi:hypothetical protein
MRRAGAARAAALPQSGGSVRQAVCALAFGTAMAVRSVYTFSARCWQFAGAETASGKWHAGAAVAVLAQRAARQ